MPERFLGRTLGKYQVEALLGTGGFAWVFQALDPDLGVRVALKVLKPQFAGDAEFEARLYACLVTKAAELGCYVHAVNGVEDHIHLIISIPPKHSVAWVVKNLKGSSSHFVNYVAAPGSTFAWQRGYGYLSLGEGQCP